VTERIVIAGGSGMIGRALATDLAVAGADVVVLSRSIGDAGSDPPGVRRTTWSGQPPKGGAPERWLEECDGAAAIVNLSGANLAGRRWSARRKRELTSSRIEPTRALVAAVGLARVKPRVLLQASGVNFYGARGDSPLDESEPPGRGFLSDLCVAWESASAPVETAGVRRVLLRSGAVLTPAGGALAKMLPAFRLGLGGPLGRGRQWFPWIHLADEVGAIRFLIERRDLSGPFNLVAPGVASQREFARTLARTLNRPGFLKVPAIALRTLFGELAEILLEGQRAVPRRLLDAGFAFRFPDLSSALSDLVG
jgi:uncharacterized protein (TIGR01777 family)